MGEIERRCFRCELRATDGQGPDGAKKIIGHAAVFNQLSEDLGGWREKVLPGAFADVLGDDVRGLFNHDPNLILGRTISGTLSLAEDAGGLAYEITPPDVSYARDLLVSMGRGDVDQSSFSFIVGEESWINPTPDQPWPIRVIHKIQRLFDVSPVTFPAYSTTSAGARSMAERLNVSPGARDTADDKQQAAGRRALRHKELQLQESEV